MGSADRFLPRPALRPGRLARLGMQRLIYWTGAGYALSKLCPAGAVILMYHSIAEDAEAAEIDPRNRMSPAEFTRQMEFLARHRQVISISELASHIEERRPLSPLSVVLTLDDGYRDNLEVAAPILKRLGLSAIIYLPTALITSGEKPWADQLYRMFRQRQRDSLHALNGRSLRFDLGSRKDCRAAFAHTSALLIAAEPAARGKILAAIKRQLEPSGDANTRPLDWDLLRRMRTDYPLIEIGLHSDNHIDLTAHNPEIVRSELRVSADTCRRELGVRAEHFAYPYNRHNAVFRQLVAESGFRTAVCSSENCEINIATDVMALPRFPAPRSMTLFRLWTQGATCSLRLANRS